MKKQFVVLDIEEISEELYQLVLEEFKMQYGKGYYGNWNITAERTKNG